MLLNAPASAQRADRIGRIFNLPSFAEPTVAVKAALLDIGRPGGMPDANDELSAGPVALITNPALSLNKPDNPLHAAGSTFVGQFMDHDMTFDSASQLDFDTVYGHGPVLSRHLYDQQDRGKLRIENGGVFEDVPRSGQPLVDEILRRGRRFYTPQRAFLPVDFQGATYRFGYSMVRPSYRANLAGDAAKPFFGFIFDPAQPRGPDPSDLVGGARAPRRFIGWQTFFDFGDGQVEHTKRIDTHLSTPLFHRPLGALASHDSPTALPQRTLLKHLTWALPSGQAIAHAMRAGAVTERSGSRQPRPVAQRRRTLTRRPAPAG